MDFKDNIDEYLPFVASSDSDAWASILGLGNKKQKSQAKGVYGADLQNRYPFSDDCDQQTRLVDALQAESAAALQLRNSSKKGKTRNELTGKLQAFDAYIPEAASYKDTVSCAKKTLTPQGGGVTGGGTTTKTGMSNTVKYSLIGLGAALIIGGIIYIKRKKII